MIRSTMANTYLSIGQFDKAAVQASEAVRLFRLVKGDDDDEASVFAVLNFAWIRLCQERLAESRELHAEGFRRAERSLPPDSELRLTAMSHYAYCLTRLGEFETATPMFERAIAAYLRTGGETAGLQMFRNNQAQLFAHQGRFAEAIPIYLKALAEHRRLTGDFHPNTLLLIRNLTEADLELERWDAAEPLARESLATAHKVFRDARSPAFELLSLAQLSRAIAGRGRLTDHRAVVGDLLAMLEHADASSFVRLNQLAIKIADRAAGLGDAENASRAFRAIERLGEAALAKARAERGPDHPETIATMTELATAYGWSREFDRSIPLFEEALRRRSARSGADHPEAWLVRANLGSNYKDVGRLDEALPLLEGAYRSGRERNSLRWVGPRLLDAYARLGRADKVVPLAAELIAAERGRRPAGSVEWAGLLLQAGAALVDVGAWVEAEPPLRESLAVREASGLDDWRTFQARAALGAALLGQGRRADAEPLLRTGYEGMRARADRIPPPSRFRLAQSLDRLIAWGEAAGKADEVKAWKAERAKLDAGAAPRPGEAKK
jgi:tetratricopeptide (TPR) repeat protein